MNNQDDSERKSLDNYLDNPHIASLIFYSYLASRKDTDSEALTDLTSWAEQNQADFTLRIQKLKEAGIIDEANPPKASNMLFETIEQLISKETIEPAKLKSFLQSRSVITRSDYRRLAEHILSSLSKTYRGTLIVYSTLNETSTWLKEITDCVRPTRKGMPSVRLRSVPGEEEVLDSDSLSQFGLVVLLITRELLGDIVFQKVYAPLFEERATKESFKVTWIYAERCHADAMPSWLGEMPSIYPKKRWHSGTLPFASLSPPVRRNVRTSIANYLEGHSLEAVLRRVGAASGDLLCRFGVVVGHWFTSDKIAEAMERQIGVIVPMGLQRLVHWMNADSDEDTWNAFLSTLKDISGSNLFLPPITELRKLLTEEAQQTTEED